jgi:threonine dehydratase
VETAFNRSLYGVELGDTAIDITMETRGFEHIGELERALDGHGYVHERVQ